MRSCGVPRVPLATVSGRSRVLFLSCLVLSCLCAWLRGGPARHPLGRGDERGAQEGLRAHALLNIPILFYKVSGGAQSSGVNISVFSIGMLATRRGERGAEGLRETHVNSA